MCAGYYDVADYDDCRNIIAWLPLGWSDSELQISNEGRIKVLIIKPLHVRVDIIG